MYGSYITNTAAVQSAFNSASEIVSEAANTASAEFSSATAESGGATTTGSSSSTKSGAAAAVDPQVLLGWGAAAGVAAVGMIF